MTDFGLEACTKARKRLMEDGVPITALHAAAEPRGESVHVAETVRCVASRHASTLASFLAAVP